MDIEHSPNGKPQERARHILFTLGRLTVLRGFLRTEPVVRLMAYCDAIAADDALGAAYQYHSMTAALLETSTRRVTGDIWKDFVFSEMLETPNRFSVLAAEGTIDPPVQQAMEHDLARMQELFSLRDSDLQRCVGAIATQAQPVDKRPAKPNPAPPQREEAISRMALSAWAGSDFISERKKTATPREPSPSEAELPQDLGLNAWIHWEYDHPGEALFYVADEALALVYRRFLSDESWSDLADALGEFHAHYGCGEFLRYRVFVATDEGLYGLDNADAPDWDDLAGLSRQKERIYANTLRFVHTGEGENLLLYGAEGMGKRSLVLALTKELPDLRLIFMAQRDYASSMETIRTLSRQPFRFIAFMGNVSLTPKDHERLRTAFLLRPGARNALLYATAAESAQDATLFGIQIPFEALDYTAFCQMTKSFLRKERGFIEDATLNAACSAWCDENGDMSARGAQRLAQSLLRELTR